MRRASGGQKTERFAPRDRRPEDRAGARRKTGGRVYLAHSHAS